MSTVLAYSYSHAIRYFTKGIDQSGPFYRVEYVIGNWSDTDGFVNALLGKSTVTGGQGGTIVRSSSHQHPLSPNLYCVSAEVVEGVGPPILASTGYPNYSAGAVIRAEYRALNFDIVSNPDNSFDPGTPILWATQELDFGHEVYTVSNSTYKFTGAPPAINNKKVGVPAKVTIPITTMVLTFERVPYMPMTAARTLRYRVNNAQFLGAAAGLVLFEGCQTTRQFNTDGSIVQKVQFVFKERDAAFPWNAMPSRTTLAWYAVVDDAGNSLFRTANLAPLVAF